MVDEEVLKRKMKIFGIAGLVIGVAIAGVAYMSYHNLFHLIFIPIAAAIGYYTPKLLVGPED